MSRRRTTSILPWLTAWGNDKNDRSFLIIGRSLLRSTAWKNLSGNAKTAYLLMADSAEGKREFDMPVSFYSEYMAKDTFQRVKTELINNGFIREKKNGANLREKNIYEFCFDWKQQNNKPPNI